MTWPDVNTYGATAVSGGAGADNYTVSVQVPRDEPALFVHSTTNIRNCSVTRAKCQIRRGVALGPAIPCSLTHPGDRGGTWTFVGTTTGTTSITVNVYTVPPPCED